MPTIHDFSGQRVLVTGGSSGLGEACVALFAEAGAAVFFCGLPGDDADGAAVAARTGARFDAVDVREPEALSAYVQGLAADGGLDIAVNSAGISHKAALTADIPLDDVAAVMTTNVMGVWHAMRAEIHAMAAQRRGAIINVGSILSSKAAGWMAAYGTSKHAVIGLTRAAAMDYAPLGLRINAISPGPINTPMFRRALDDIGNDPSKFAGGLPPEGPADPADVAAIVAFLASPDSADLSGANLILDSSSAAGWALDQPVDIRPHPFGR